jgi:phage shock protein A
VEVGALTTEIGQFLAEALEDTQVAVETAILQMEHLMVQAVRAVAQVASTHLLTVA